LQHNGKRGQPGYIHADKQARMFANKADAKARTIVTFFAMINVVNGFVEQPLDLCHLTPSY